MSDDNTDAAKPLTDAELEALTLLYRGEVAEMEAENQKRLQGGWALAYSDMSTPTSERIRVELKRRGVL